MKGKLKRYLTLGLSAVLLAGAFAACGGKGSGGGTGGSDNKFTYWISAGEDSSYYGDYRNNPAIEYLLDYKTYEVDGREATIDLEFMVPVTGSEVDNFNTLLATGEYADILDMARYNGSVVELYEEGVVLDISEYVEKYMPNYRAFLDAHPDLAITATNVVNGEIKYLQLYNYNESLFDQLFNGYMYRRDWIVKYGTNPVDGSAFEGGYSDPANPDSWTDNVVFPSGGDHPYYISDWEWMFGIFETAMQDLGITDGYCTTLYYPGYLEIGDLVSAFGGGAGHWYRNKDNEIVFGATSENFRVYLQAMNTWYANGWIDTAFTEHANDMFFRIDDTKVRNGKVGLWMGQISSFGNSMETGDDDFTKGIMAYAAPQPINDIYGGAEQQNVEPYAFYRPDYEVASICITDKAAEKDLPALFTFLDFMYTWEGAQLKGNGLSKQQYEETGNAMYEKYGLTEGFWWFVDEEANTYERNPIIAEDGGTLENAAVGVRIFGKMNSGRVERNEIKKTTMELWNMYEVTAKLPASFISQLSSEDAKTFSKIETNIREFMSKNVPGMINGAKDPYNDADWEAFVAAIEKYSPDTNTQIYQNLLDSLLDE